MYDYMPQNIWIIWRPNDGAMSNRHIPAVEPFSQEQVNQISCKSTNKKKTILSCLMSAKAKNKHIVISIQAISAAVIIFMFHCSAEDQKGISNSNCLKYYYREVTLFTAWAGNKNCCKGELFDCIR